MRRLPIPAIRLTFDTIDGHKVAEGPAPFRLPISGFRLLSNLKMLGPIPILLSLACLLACQPQPEDEPETEEVQAEQNTETETDAEESMPSNEIKQETDEDEETEDDDLIASILESVDEPSPMISASLRCSTRACA